jgi:hypothetical protein
MGQKIPMYTLFDYVLPQLSLSLSLSTHVTCPPLL